MSGLNKVLMGTLVLLSLALSSAVIVWVNKTEDFKRDAALANDKLAKESKARVDASSEAQVAKEALQLAMKTYNVQIEQVQSELKSKEAEISKRDVQLADISGQVRQQTLALVASSEALKASEAQKKQQHEQLADLRNTMDKIQKEKADLNLAVSDLTNKNEVLNREFKYVKEQLAEAQGSTDRLSGQLKDMGVNPNPQVPGLKAGAPAITGVIREVRTLNDNRTWASISVGSANSVEKGMEFKVIDPQSGSFLGVLTVENVQPNEAVGTLVGPKVPQIKSGNEVRTQI